MICAERAAIKCLETILYIFVMRRNDWAVLPLIPKGKY